MQDAVLLLAGLRRPYTTNIAQVLGLSMPKLLPSTRSLGEMRADMLADADRQRASNLARAERNQRALEAETKAATMVQAQAIAALKEKLRLNGKLPSVPSEKPPEA